MIYQPFLDMHILVSDDLLQQMPAIVQATVLAILTTILTILIFIWLLRNA